MKVLFYAPMKPPDHANPSGDRRMARQFMALLESLGHEVTLASRLRTWQREPDARGLAHTHEAARPEVARLAHAEADLFVTYRQYHKAPDLIGPATSAALGIPYVILEASHAERRRHDGWSRHLDAAECALKAAHAVVAMHRVDRRGLEPVVPGGRLHTLLPFLAPLPPAPLPRPRGGPIRLVTVAMMRAGDKARSFDILADAWRRVNTDAFHLTIVGDGPERDRIEALFSPETTTFTGYLDGAELAETLAASDAFVWPAWREAYGMAILEAMAARLPVIAGDAGGIPDIVVEGTGLLTPVGDAEAFADAIRSFAGRRDHLAAMGKGARAHVERYHSPRRARADLSAIIDAAIAEARR